MRLSLPRGPMLLLLWQAAPVSFQPDSAGRVQVVLGYGAGQFEQRELNCAGDVVSADPVPFTSRGAQIDAWPATDVRVTAYGGALSYLPSVYLRAGSRDGAHFRLDLAPPTPTPGATGDLLRMGVGVNQGPLHGARGFLGFSAGPLVDQSNVGGIFGDVEFP